MIMSLMLVLAQGLVVDGVRYHVAEDGRLQATRIADEKALYQWWPDPPASPLTGSFSATAMTVADRPRKLLAAGIGSAPGIYVLDISRPDQTAADPVRVLTSDAASGRITSAPVFATLGPDARPFVLSSAGEGAPRAGLLLLPLDTQGYYLLEVQNSGAALGAIGIARHPSGRALYAYAGDASGKLWRFDLTGKVPWSQPRLRRPVFSAMRDDGMPQAITEAPTVMFGPEEGYLVAFGTSASARNTLYAYHDRLGAPRNADRTKLARRKIRPEPDGVRFEGRPVDYRHDAGWFVDLGCAEGERMAGLSAVFGVLAVSTVIQHEARTDGCAYALDALTGLPPDDGVTGKKIANVGEHVAELIAIGPLQETARMQARVTTVQQFQLVRRDADGQLHDLDPVRIEQRYGRLSWRELPHWRALHQARKQP